MIGAGCVEARSTKQDFVTVSSTESELVALSGVVDSAVTMHEFLQDIGVSTPPPVILQDNMSTIALVKNGRGRTRTRHLRARQNNVKQYLDASMISVEYTPTKTMIADLLTKPMQGTAFRTLRDALSGTTGTPEPVSGYTSNMGVRWNFGSGEDEDPESESGAGNREAAME